MKCNGAYLGPQFSDLDIEQDLRKYKAVAKKYEKENFDELYGQVADLIKRRKCSGLVSGENGIWPACIR
jgi:predicted NodU family carbamoyl transferase